MIMIGLGCVKSKQLTHLIVKLVNLPVGVFAVAVVAGAVDAVDSVDDVAGAVDDAAVEVDDAAVEVDDAAVEFDVVDIAVDEAAVDMLTGVNPPDDVVIVEVFVAGEDVVTVPVEDADTEFEEEIYISIKNEIF